MLRGKQKLIIRLIFGLAALLIISAGFFYSLPTPKTSAGVNINDASNFGRLYGGRQIVRTSSGTIYAFIACGIWKSSNGATWTEQDSGNKPSCVNTTIIAGSSIAIDSNNLIHIVYIDDLTLSATYTTFNTSGDTFGSSTILETVNNNMYNVDIAVDSNNKPHVIYGGNNFNGFNYDEFIRYRNNVSGSWSTARTVKSTEWNNEAIFTGAIAIDEDNVPEIIYHYMDSTFSTPALEAALGNANNATAFSITTIDSDVEAGVYPSIAIDSAGNTWIGYADLISNDVMIARQNDSDVWSSWAFYNSSNVSLVGSSSSGLMRISLAVNGSDIYVFYTSASTTNVVYDRYNGAWLGQTVLDSRATAAEIVVKWSNFHNNQGSTQIDYLYSDATDVFWNKLDLNSNSSPMTPSLLSPASSASGISTTPLFQLRSSDADNDSLRYRIEVCTTSNCSGVLRNIDQNSSQTGWSGQDAGLGLNYTGSSSLASSTVARHLYRTPVLAPNTQYWWRAYARDPGGSNTESAASAIQSFTTAAGSEVRFGD